MPKTRCTDKRFGFFYLTDKDFGTTITDCRCKGPPTDDAMTECDNCLRWSHDKCYKTLTKQSQETLPGKPKKFKCKQCKDAQGSALIHRSKINTRKLIRDYDNKQDSDSEKEHTPNDTTTQQPTQGALQDISNNLNEPMDTVPTEEASMELVPYVPQPSTSRAAEQQPDGAINPRRKVTKKRSKKAAPKPRKEKPRPAPKLVSLVSSDSESSDDDEYTVEKIVAVEEKPAIRTNRKFEVKWKGYPSSQNSWIHEQDLKNAGDLLADFCRKEGIPGPHFTQKVGATHVFTPSGKFLIGEDNCMAIEKVVALLKSRLYGDLKTQLPIETAIAPDSLDLDQDKLILLCRDMHLYVLCYVSEYETVYIADGENVFCAQDEEEEYMDSDEEDIELQDKAAEYKRLLTKERKNIYKLLAGVKRIVPIKFNSQRGLDHCGSSAIAIGVLFVQSYKTKVWREAVLPQQSVLEMVRRAHHKLPSEYLKKGTIPINKQNNIHCPKCNRRFWKNSGFVSHVRSCNK